MYKSRLSTEIQLFSRAPVWAGDSLLPVAKRWYAGATWVECNRLGVRDMHSQMTSRLIQVCLVSR